MSGFGNVCEECYNEICTCGTDYEGWDTHRLRKHIIMLSEILDRKVKVLAERASAFMPYETSPKEPNKIVCTRKPFPRKQSV